MSSATAGNPLLVIAVASPYAWDVVESARRDGHTVACVDNHGDADPNLPGLCALDSITGRDQPFTVGLSAALHRTAAYRSLALAGFATPVPLVDPTAVVASTVTLGHGVYVNAGAVIGSNTALGCMSNVNRSASLGHDNRLGAGASVGPGATTGGGVTIGAQTLVGVGAVLLPGVTIGECCTIGGGAVVVADVEPGSVVVGNPAAVIRRNDDREPESCPYC